MAFLTIAEIKTHLYNEVVSEINRTDDTIVQSAIDAAIDQVKGYLTVYDTDAIFNATGDDRNKIILLYTKDIAVWHFINLANPTVDMELRKTRYDDAITELGKIQSGKTNPSLPYPPAPTDGSNANNFIKWGSNTKRNNYY